MKKLIASIVFASVILAAGLSFAADGWNSPTMQQITNTFFNLGHAAHAG